MKNLIDSITLYVFRTSAIETLGWTLLHFLWQGTLIALILAVLVWLLRNRHPSLRYLLACASLAFMLACPIVTYLVLDSSNSRPPVVETALQPPTEVVAEPALVNDVPAQPVANAVVFAPEGGTGKKTSWLERNLKPWLPYLVVFWGVGVLVLSIRLLGGLWVLRKLRTRLTKPVSTVLMAQLNNVAERLGLARPVQLRESLVVTVPLVVGWLKPMILLPSSVMSGLSVKQLEMILAHELAHIRRHDYLVNLLQSVIETLLFYHPGVWWVSAKIRAERELCCDDLAVKVCGGDKQSYAQALSDLDDLRTHVQLVQAATGGSLVNRVLRLLDKAIPKSLDPRQWMVGLSVIALSLVMFTVIGINLTVAQDEQITLRLGIADPQGRPSQAYLEEFIAQVKTLSEGKITIEPFWEAGLNTTPTFEQGVAKAMVEGQYDLGLAASRAWDSVGVTSLQPLQAPFLINNDAIAEAVAASDIAKQMLEGMSTASILGLTLWPDVLNHSMAFDFEKPFLSPEDFKDKTIRIIGSNITSAMYEAFGATAIVKEDWGGDIAAGLIQGTELGIAQGFALPAPAVVVGNVAYYPKYHVLAANSASFERLSDEQQNILREAASIIQKKAIAEHPKEIDAATAFCENGFGEIVLANDEQLAAFEEAVKPVYALIEQDPKNAEFIAAIRELKANTPAAPGAEACKTATTQESSAPSSDTEGWSGGLPPNGVYRNDVTYEDLVARGAAPEFARNNAGWMTWTINDEKIDIDMHWEDLEGKTGDCTHPYSSTGDVLQVTIPVGSCSPTGFTLEMNWREHTDGGLEFLVLSASEPALQFLLDMKALFNRVWQKVGEVDTWEKGLPPNGTWQAELTQADLIVAGLPKEKTSELIGMAALTFQDGKFTSQSQIDGNHPGSCEGNYALVEGVVRMTFGGLCTGEVDVQWRLEDDGIHFHLIAVKNEPFLVNKVYLEAKPWQKVETWSEGLPPNGTWQVELTPDDMVRMGVTPSNAEIYAGVVTWTFENGQGTGSWTFENKSQESINCTASYLVVDDFVRIKYNPGKGCGEGDGYDDIQWRLEDDRLHMHLVKTTFPEVAENRAWYGAKLWQKIE